MESNLSSHFQENVGTCKRHNFDKSHNEPEPDRNSIVGEHANWSYANRREMHNLTLKALKDLFDILHPITQDCCKMQQHCRCQTMDSITK